VRLGTYSEKGPPPPGAAVAVARLADDPNDEAQYGERVRYVVTRAGPGDQLRHRAIAPEKLLFDERFVLCIDDTYGTNLFIAESSWMQCIM
jgi:DNA polymerase zeta